MNKLLKKRMLIISISLAFLLLINIGISYSYYLGKVVGNESSTTVSLTSAGIIINYENNSGVITDNSITPGWSTAKKFSVSSTFNQESTNLSKLWYVVRLCVDDNEFLSDKIVYSLTTDGEITGNGKALDNVENKGIATGTNEEGIVIGSGYFVSGSNQHNYNLTFKYIDSEVISSGSKFNVHIVVEASLEAEVNINLDGGNISGSTQISSVKFNTIALEEPTKKGYYFEGWEIISGNGTINGNELYINDTNITVKANYREQSFANDSWEEIVTAVRNGNTEGYKIGDTKEIPIDGYTNNENGSGGLYTVRVANKSTPDACSGATFSQTACGFVVEFVDIIEKRTMNYSAFTSFLNGVLFDSLPFELRNVIIPTNVTHNSSNIYSSNIYILGCTEVNFNGYWEQSDDKSLTRQLDYYSKNGVGSGNDAAAIKYYNDSATAWWLRGASTCWGDYWHATMTNGTMHVCKNDEQCGVAPAFRIG